jgi:hypothetical protein
MSLDYSTAIPVHSVVEEHGHIAAHPCSCNGQWRVILQALLKGAQGRHYDRVDAVCRKCGARRTFLFDISSIFAVV